MRKQQVIVFGLCIAISALAVAYFLIAKSPIEISEQDLSVPPDKTLRTGAEASESIPIEPPMTEVENAGESTPASAVSEERSPKEVTWPENPGVMENLVYQALNHVADTAVVEHVECSDTKCEIQLTLLASGLSDSTVNQLNRSTQQLRQAFVGPPFSRSVMVRSAGWSDSGIFHISVGLYSSPRKFFILN